MRRGRDAYAGRMKIIISIPDHVIAAADALAVRIGVSRDDLHATAIAEFLAGNGASEVTTRFDAPYSREPSAPDPGIRQAQGRSIRHERW